MKDKYPFPATLDEYDDMRRQLLVEPQNLLPTDGPPYFAMAVKQAPDCDTDAVTLMTKVSGVHSESEEDDIWTPDDDGPLVVSLHVMDFDPNKDEPLQLYFDEEHWYVAEDEEPLDIRIGQAKVRAIGGFMLRPDEYDLEYLCEIRASMCNEDGMTPALSQNFFDRRPCNEGI